MGKRVLIVDDDVLQQRTLSQLLEKRLNLLSYIASDGKQALNILSERDTHQHIKLVILDIQMPVMNGIEALEIMKKRYPALPVIMLTGSHETSDVVNAMNLGASDFVSKPYEVERLILTIQNVLKIRALSREVSELKEEKKGRCRFEQLVGHDSGLKKSVEIGRKAAASDISVLLSGETGVGKEVFARAIHGQSNRSHKPFIAVNCGAIPENLVESILFGHEKGAFTGATEKTLGKFREAEGGTIFFDEVGELPLETQVKLLRVLQQKEVEPVGGKRSVPVNVRVISATNRDLSTEVKAGRFREDLFFRLNILEIILPPLRDRKQDISLLTHYFVKKFCHAEDIPIPEVTDGFITELEQKDWSGNVRELENTVNKAIVLSDSHALLPNKSLRDVVLEEKRQEDYLSSVEHLSMMNGQGDFKTMKEVEQEMMHRVLDHFNGNVTKASKALGIAKSTFYRKLGS